MNLLSYFAFLIPLTSLAVYGRTNEDSLCTKDNSTDSGYEVYIHTTIFLSAESAMRERGRMKRVGVVGLFKMTVNGLLEDFLVARVLSDASKCTVIICSAIVFRFFL